MFDLKGINIENFKIKIGSFIGHLFLYNKEEHNEQTLKVELQKTEVIGQQIAHQINLNLPEGVPQGDQLRLVKALLDDPKITTEETSVSKEASGDAKLPASTTSLPAETFLKTRYNEYLKDNSLLLDRGGLLLIYKERENILFTIEELVLLTQSSFKNNFPAWFWMLNHRERFENVVPLLQKVFIHPLQKIRRGVISALSGFTDTGDEIVTLMQSEHHPEVIGLAVSIFFEKKDVDRAQRVIANALTRKIIPTLTKKGEEMADKIKIDLGIAERRFLHDIIENDWQTEKLRALRILSSSAEESDLIFLEKMLTEATYTNIINLILTCIAHIGKTNIADYIEKDLFEARWKESFTAHLNVLVKIGHKAIFSKLLEWLGDINKVTRKFWQDEINKGELEEKIEDAIIYLLDVDTYELLVEYILLEYSPDKEYGNIMSWRYFKVLKQAYNKQKIASLLRVETRLIKFSEWLKITKEAELGEKTNIQNLEKLLLSISPEESEEAYTILRRVYTIISPEQAVNRIPSIIEQFRKNLTARLTSITNGEHSKEIIELTKNDFEKFLGDNQLFYRLQTKKKRKEDNPYEIEGEDDKEFKTLSEDIKNFTIIEKEYFTHIFKARNEKIKNILIDSIGRPYECIYDSITNSDEKDTLGDRLIDVIKNCPNPLIRLKSIEALFRLDVANNDVLRAVTLTILIEARDNTKASRGMAKRDDDWFVSEISYLWAINTLTEFGNPSDFNYIQEAVNREKILARSYHRYSHFFDYKVIEELLDLSENLEDLKEKNNALLALDSLDYAWTKKVLKVDN